MGVSIHVSGRCMLREYDDAWGYLGGINSVKTHTIFTYTHILCFIPHDLCFDGHFNLKIHASSHSRRKTKMHGWNMCWQGGFEVQKILFTGAYTIHAIQTPQIFHVHIKPTCTATTYFTPKCSIASCPVLIFSPSCSTECSPSSSPLLSTPAMPVPTALSP